LVIGVVTFIILLAKNISSNPGTQSIASVNNNTISKSVYQKRLAETESFYKWGDQNVKNISSLKGDVLDKLIDEEIIKDYAEKNKITVTANEIENRYKQVVAGYNKNNSITGGGDSAFLTKIKDMYGTQKEDYLQQLAYDILRDKVQTAVKMPITKWLESQKKSADIKRY